MIVICPSGNYLSQKNDKVKFDIIPKTNEEFQ